MSDPLNHLRSIWYHSEPSDVPYFPNQYLGWDFFCRFLQQVGSNFVLVLENSKTCITIKFIILFSSATIIISVLSQVQVLVSDKIKTIKYQKYFMLLWVKSSYWNFNRVATHHSVLERIWIKDSYLSQWLPQGERGPPKESKSRWIEILHVGSQEQSFFSKFFLD